MNVLNYIKSTTKKRGMHFSLMDPDQKKSGLKEAGETAAKLGKMGTDVILVGGSTNIKPEFLDDFVLTVKKNFKGPVILFPGGLDGVTKYADAILLMSLVNSRNPYWITGVQSKAAPYIKQTGVEAIPMAYLIIEPGMKVGEIGEADLIKREDSKRTGGYAAAAELSGFALIYLEAGSGAPQHVPIAMVESARKNAKIPLIVGGGIRKAEDAKKILQAGADIIVTGTVIEDDVHKVKDIITVVKHFKKQVI